MRWLCALGTVLVVLASARGEDIDAVKLKQNMVGSVVALRQPLRGSEITFETDGHPVPPIQHGTFGRDALLRIDDLKIEGRSLEVDCRRVLMLARVKAKGMEFYPTNEKTRVIVILPSRSEQSAYAVLDRVFRRTAETGEVLTNYGRAFGQDGVLEPDRRVRSCQLRVIAHPAPYGPAGGKFRGRVIVNEFGEPEAVSVVDAPKSKREFKIYIATLWDWRFAPSFENGKRTACTSDIVMRFANRERNRLHCNNGC